MVYRRLRKIYMKVLKETTKWNGDYPNHTYILNDKSMLIGYIPFGEPKPSWFSKPMTFYKSRRTFIEQSPEEYACQ